MPYYVERETEGSDATLTYVGARREAFSTAARLAREYGKGTTVQVRDALGIEGTIARWIDGRRCTCTAEARLLRAIFNEAHPVKCQEREGE